MSVAGEQAEPLGRVARKRIRRINEILRVAAEVLSEKGYAGTNLEEVADRVDLAKASLYHYFDSKEALFSACLGTPAEELISRLAAITDGGGSPRERLRQLVVEQVRFTTYDDAELSRLFLQHLDWPESINAKLHDWRLRHDAIFKQVIEEGVATGDFVLRDATVARQCLIGALTSVPFWGYKTDGRYTTDELVEVVADSVLPLFAPPRSGADAMRRRRPEATPPQKSKR
ncbi:MAG: TetR/AcrR family transcriptional regulator [Acidimicrobiia bacterium]